MRRGERFSASPCRAALAAALALACSIVPAYAATSPTREQLLTQARAQHDDGHRAQALGLCETLLQRWPDDGEALVLRVRLLSELGAAGRALELAHALPAPLPPADMARLEADAAAHQTRWTQAMPADTRQPYAEADRAVALENAALERHRQLPAGSTAAVIADRLVAHDRASLSESALRDDQALRAQGATLPPYAAAALADALMQQRQPEQAIPLYEEALRADPGPYAQEQTDPRIGLAYAYLEAGRYRNAVRLADHVAETEPAWLAVHGSHLAQSNAHKVDAAVTAAKLRQEAWLYRDAWRRLQALRAEGPANASIWHELAEVERMRGWPRRAEDSLMSAVGLDPDDIATRLSAIEAWRELGDFPRVEPALRDVEAVSPRDLHVSLARQSWDRQRGWQFDVDHTRGRGGAANFGDADHETEATVQSPLLADRWRLYGITRLAYANLPEGEVRRERLGLGLRGYARGLEAYVQALPALGGGTRRTAYEAGLRWLPTDHWTYTLDWSNTGDRDVPLRAHYYGVTAHALDVSAQWRASEQSVVKLGASADHFSDGNRRYGWQATWTQRAYTAPWLTVDAGLDTGATRNSRSDVAYYSPACARWTAATGRLENMLYQRYERMWRQRIDISLGSYHECRYGSGWMASARYGQTFEPRGGLAFGWGLGWASQPYDGKRDNRVMLDLTLHWGE